MTIRFLAAGTLFLAHAVVYAQENADPVFTKAIEDNSFFIEEAYNQEDRVVQHINNGTFSLDSTHDFMYSFTQEWPVFSQKHQFSYTLGFASLDSRSVNGFTDILLNYRFQLTDHDAFITLAPRLSLIIPAGDAKRNLGNGVVGYQFNLPGSKRISNGLVCHANVGFTLLPGIKYTDSENHTVRNTTYIVNMGGSAIWLMTYHANLMFEFVHNIFHQADDNGEMVTSGQTIISPGLRYAFDLKSLQIVPGVALPVILQDKNARWGIFIYLSFEHPF